MQLRFVAAGAAAFSLWFMPALAGDDTVVLQALARCAAISSDAARLSCYDGLAPRVRATMAAPAGPTAPTAPHAAAPKMAAAPTKEEEKSWFGFDMGNLFGSNPQNQTTPAQFGADKTPADHVQRQAAARELDSITAGVADYAFNPLDQFIVTLDNGQIWKQLAADGGRARFARTPSANTVTIERGAIGSYILSINGGNRVFKVTRIK